MTRTLRFFRTRCLDCNADFAMPSLSDFSYGQFIWSGERGTGFAYFDACDSPIFEHIKSVMKRAVGYPTSPTHEDTDRFHFVVAGCARKIEGQKLVPHHVCPTCRSRNVSPDDNEPVADCQVEDASYDEFLAKPALEQILIVTILCNKWDEKRRSNQ
jgi:hypothetical protein